MTKEESAQGAARPVRGQVVDLLTDYYDGESYRHNRVANAILAMFPDQSAEVAELRERAQDLGHVVDEWRSRACIWEKERDDLSVVVAGLRRKLEDERAMRIGADGDVVMLQKACDAFKQDNVDAAMSTVRSLAQELHKSFEEKFDPILTKEWRERCQRAEKERDELRAKLEAVKAPGQVPSLEEIAQALHAAWSPIYPPRAIDTRMPTGAAWLDVARKAVQLLAEHQRPAAAWTGDHADAYKHALQLVDPKMRIQDAELLFDAGMATLRDDLERVTGELEEANSLAESRAATSAQYQHNAAMAGKEAAALREAKEAAERLDEDWQTATGANSPESAGRKLSDLGDKLSATRASLGRMTAERDAALARAEAAERNLKSWQEACERSRNEFDALKRMLRGAEALSEQRANQLNAATAELERLRKAIGYLRGNKDTLGVIDATLATADGEWQPGEAFGVCYQGIAYVDGKYSEHRPLGEDPAWSEGMRAKARELNDHAPGTVLDGPAAKAFMLANPGRRVRDVEHSNTHYAVCDGAIRHVDSHRGLAFKDGGTFDDNTYIRRLYIVLPPDPPSEPETFAQLQAQTLNSSRLQADPPSAPKSAPYTLDKNGAVIPVTPSAPVVTVEERVAVHDDVLRRLVSMLSTGTFANAMGHGRFDANTLQVIRWRLGIEERPQEAQAAGAVQGGSDA